MQSSWSSGPPETRPIARRGAGRRGTMQHARALLGAGGWANGPDKLFRRAQWRTIALAVLALSLVVGVWFGLADLSHHARIAFITFGLAILGWVLTSINDTYIALAAAIVFALTGIDQPDEFFEALGDSSIWLLLARSE